MVRRDCRTNEDTADETLISILEYCFDILQPKASIVSHYKTLRRTKERLDYLILHLSALDNAVVALYNPNISGILYSVADSFGGQNVEYDVNLELCDDILEMARIFDSNEDVPTRRIIEVIVKLHGSLSKSGFRLIEFISDEDEIEESTRNGKATTGSYSIDDDDDDAANDDQRINSNQDEMFDRLDGLIRKQLDGKRIAVEEIDDILKGLKLRNLRFIRRAVIKRLLDIKMYIASTENYEDSCISYDVYIEREIRDIYRCLNNGTLQYDKCDLLVDILIIRYKLKNMWTKICLHSRCVGDFVLISFHRFCKFFNEIFGRSTTPRYYRPLELSYLS